MAPHTSVVWKFFRKNGDGSATCKNCKKTYQTSGNTSNLMGHLKKNAFRRVGRERNERKWKS